MHNNTPWLLRRWFRMSSQQRQAEFWTPQQGAAELGCSESTLADLMNRGKLPYIRIFDRVYIHAPSLCEVVVREDVG